MSLIPASVLVVAVVCALVASALALVEPWIHPALDRLGPGARARWILVLLLAPLLAGGGVLALALGHCVASRLLGTVDDCEGILGRGCALCVYGTKQLHPAAWGVAVLCVSPLTRAIVRAASGARRVRRARQLMEMVAERSSADTFRVPGAHAFVAGWPQPAVFVGEALAQALTPLGVAAVTAHEREHLRRGDVTLRLLSRAIASTHLPSTGQRLIEALDIAVEQACDAHASQEVADPLIVAQALLDTARLHDEQCGEHGCVAATLPARIDALCSPRREPQGSYVLPGVTLVALAMTALVFDHEVHRAAELVVLIVTR